MHSFDINFHLFIMTFYCILILYTKTKETINKINTIPIILKEYYYKIINVTMFNNNKIRDIC